MNRLTKKILNSMSAENGRILVTDELIRLCFPQTENGYRFLESLNGDKTRTRLNASSDLKNIDIELKSLQN